MGKKLDSTTGKWIDVEENAANKAEEDKTPQSPLTAQEIENLDNLSKEELIALVRCLPVVSVAHSLLSREEKRERLKLKVYTIAMESKNDASILKAANDWLDREDGKAAVSINQNVNVTGAIAVMSKEEAQGYIDDWKNKALPHA